MKSDKWYVHFPNDCYAIGPIYFNEQVKENEVREHLRKEYKVKKLPAYTEIWIAY